MKKLTTFVMLSLALFTNLIAASAGERAITLAVENMAVWSAHIA